MEPKILSNTSNLIQWLKFWKKKVSSIWKLIFCSISTSQITGIRSTESSYLYFFNYTCEQYEFIITNITEIIYFKILICQMIPAPIYQAFGWCFSFIRKVAVRFSLDMVISLSDPFGNENKCYFLFHKYISWRCNEFW